MKEAEQQIGATTQACEAAIDLLSEFIHVLGDGVPRVLLHVPGTS
jgi:hypothetical protein